MSTLNLYFEQKYEKYQNLLSENFQFLIVKNSVYSNRQVFVMCRQNVLGCSGDITLALFSLETPKRVTGKQCRPRSVGGGCGKRVFSLELV